MECDKFFCGKSSFNRIELGLTDVSVSGCRGAVFFFAAVLKTTRLRQLVFGERAMRLLVVLECLARFLYEETNLHVELVPLLPVCRALAVWNTALQDWLNNTVRAMARYQLAFAVGPSGVTRPRGGGRSNMKQPSPTPVVTSLLPKFPTWRSQPPSQVSNMKIHCPSLPPKCPTRRSTILVIVLEIYQKQSTDLQLKTALKHGCLRCEGCSVGLRGDEINISKRGKSCDLFPPVRDSPKWSFSQEFLRKMPDQFRFRNHIVLPRVITIFGLLMTKVDPYTHKRSFLCPLAMLFL